MFNVLHENQHSNHKPRLANYIYIDFKVCHYTLGREEFIACKDSIVLRDTTQEGIQRQIEILS